jgi:hypothetical protein
MATELLSSDNRDLAKVALSWFLSQDSNELAVGPREFLRDEDEAFRIRSLCWLVKHLERRDMETSLLAYVESGTYYYDVVTWLDRLLYAPPHLRESFARKLERESADS